MKASIKRVKGNLSLIVNKKVISPAAYMAYLEKNADYDGFYNAGYSLRSVCVYMGNGGTNENAKLAPFNRHVWVSENNFDFSVLDESLQRALGEDSFVILRVNLNVPLWWREKYPQELTKLSDGKTYMQSIFSKIWLDECEKCLTKLRDHILSSPYSEKVIGIQVAAMQTEEWIGMETATGQLDFSTPAKLAFRLWLKKKYKKIDKLNEAWQVAENSFETIELPEVEQIALRNKESIVELDKFVAFTDYLTFFNDGFSSVIKYLCKRAKVIFGKDMLVGAFYGYLGQLSGKNGHAKISKLICDKNIDFFASPFSYVDGRQTIKDWFYHTPLADCRKHNKLWFMEADVRTCYTKLLSETNIELFKKDTLRDYYDMSIFLGPKTEEASIWNILRSFSKILIAQNAFWWFDMWGGWYKSEKMMSLMAELKKLYDKEIFAQRERKCEFAVVLDENATYGVSDYHYWEMIYCQLAELGFVGTNYDLYLRKGKVRALPQYKLTVYLSPYFEDGTKGNIVCYGKDNTIKETMFTYQEVSEKLRSQNGHVYSESNIVYANEKYVCLTASKKGKVELIMPKACKIKGFLSQEVYESADGKFVFDWEEGQTELFEILS